jgi:hypothetical protein
MSKVILITFLDGSQAQVDNVVSVTIDNDNGYVKVIKHVVFDDAKADIYFNLAAVKTYIVDHNPKPAVAKQPIALPPPAGNDG